MKFEIDTKTKTVTLIEAITFKQLKNLAEFLGNEAEDYTIEAKEVERIVTRDNYWPVWPRRAYPWPIYDVTCNGGSSWSNLGNSAYAVEIADHTTSELRVQNLN